MKNQFVKIFLLGTLKISLAASIQFWSSLIAKFGAFSQAAIA